MNKPRVSQYFSPYTGFLYRLTMSALNTIAKIYTETILFGLCVLVKIILYSIISIMLCINICGCITSILYFKDIIKNLEKSNKKALMERKKFTKIYKKMLTKG